MCLFDKSKKETKEEYYDVHIDIYIDRIDMDVYIQSSQNARKE